MTNDTARRIRARFAAVTALTLMAVGGLSSASQAAPGDAECSLRHNFECVNGDYTGTDAVYNQNRLSGEQFAWVEARFGLGQQDLQDGHNCARYALFRAVLNGLEDPGTLGAPGDWGDHVGSSPVPAVGSIAEWTWGHVAYVEKVEYVGGEVSRIFVTEDAASGWSRARWITPNGDYPDHFIHLADVVVADGAPQVHGTPLVGETLEAVPGSWPLAPTSVTFEWFSNGHSVQTGPTYQLQQSDIGASIWVVETATIPGRATKPSESSRQTVTAGQFEGMTAATVAGVPHVGNVLSATLHTTNSGYTLAYQWKRDGSPIDGAYHESYTVTDYDLGKQISVDITLTATGYEDKTVSSGWTEAVEPAAVVLSPVTVTGTAEFGSTLTASAEVGTAGATLVFQWYRNGFPISGAQAPTYPVGSSDIGASITVTATASRPTYLTSTRISQPVVPVAASISMSGVTIGGTARVFQTLTANVSVSTPGAAVAYAWYRNGTTLVGTGSSYSTTVNDNGAVISVNVTVSKAGYATAYRNSAGVTISPALMGTFYATAQGTNRVEYTLSAAVTSATPGVTLTYYWKRNGSTVSTGSSYTLQPADIGQTMTLTVTGTKSGYATSTSTYGIGTTAGYLSYSFSGAPASISGTAKVGKTLTAVTGLQTSGVTITYRWYRDGSPLSATGKTYTLVSADKGKKITVRIYFDKLGHQATSSLSNAVTIS